MKTRLLLPLFALFIAISPGAFAQSGPKAGEKKAAPVKTPGDLAFDEFNKVRNDPAGKPDQARFQKVIAAGLGYLTEFPTHGRVNDAVRDLAYFGMTMREKTTAPYRPMFVAQLKYEVINARGKEGLSNDAKAAIAAVDAAACDFEAREAMSRPNLDTLREKIDTLASMPGAGRYLAERERSYAHIQTVAGAPARAEESLKKLLEHPERGVANMARSELNILELRKTPLELKFTTIDGKEVDFAQLRGKVVALYFWNSTNATSVKNFDFILQAHTTYRKKGFEVVTVSYDKAEDREKVTKFMKENRMVWPVYFDGKGAKNDFSPKLNADRAPMLMVFDQKGIVQVAFQNTRLTHDLPANQLEPQVKKLLGIK